MRKLAYIATTFLALVCSSTITAEPPVDDIQVRLILSQPDQLRRLLSQGLDVVYVSGDSVDIITNPTQMAALTEAGYKPEVVHESVGAFYRSRLPEKDMGGYKTLDEINAYLDGIIADHPGIVSSKISIGTTIEGRPMWAAKISDNPNVDEDETELLFTAAIHAREVNTPDILFYYVDHVTNNYGIDPQITDLVDNREIWIIPCSNPDGYYHNEVIAPDGGGMWRSNRRDNGDGTFGVDLNRNYGYMWGYDDNGSSPDPSSPTYRGTAPFSEPETQALRDFAISRNFVLALHWHQYSNVTIYPWAYDYLATPDDDLFSAIGDSIYHMNGYPYGLIVDMINYAANGGAFDWDYGEQTVKDKIFSFTIEAGTSDDGFWPTLARAQMQREENLGPMLFLTRVAGGLKALQPPGPPEIVGLPTSVPATGYTVDWTHDDPDNPATRYELVELQQRRAITDPAESLDGWQTDLFTPTTARSASPPSSLASGMLSGASAYLEAVYPYSVATGDQLTFNAYCDLESYRDFAYVEVSTDGETYVSIPGNITSDFDPYGTNLGNGISGLSGAWVEAVFDLAAYEGQAVWFRFVCRTVASTTGEGLFLDDIHPHLVFDSRTVVSSTLTDPTYDFVTKPMGVYYYEVRAMDAENQWSDYSLLARTDVLGAGTGDLDLDGADNSIADLALYNLYFQQGLSVFDVYPETQWGQTDINCDGVTLSSADVTDLSQIVLGALEPCYNEGTGADEPAARSTPAAATSYDPAFADGEAAYAVELQSESFQSDDSVLIDIVLTSANSGLLGFRLGLQFDNDVFTLEEVRPGEAFANWQHFDHRETAALNLSGLALVGLAWSGGDPLTADDILPPTLPATIARLKLTLPSTGLPERTDLRFVWDQCGSNAIVAGGFDATDLTIDSLVLSRRVVDGDGSEITGISAAYGGADYDCFYELFGARPAAAVDFSNAVVEFDLSCCEGVVGDVNGEGGDEPTISDISVLVDHLFISGAALGCLAEADVNQSGGVYPVAGDITIGDVSSLIDHLFIQGDPLFDCL